MQSSKLLKALRLLDRPLSAFALRASADSKRAEAREASGGGSRAMTVRGAQLIQPNRNLF